MRTISKENQEKTKKINREENKKENYYAQFDTRKLEITKERQGVGLKSTIKTGSLVRNMEAQEQTKNTKDTTESEIDIVKRLMEKLLFYLEKDEKLKNMVITK